MDQGGTWHGGGISPGHIVLDGNPLPLPKKGTEPSICGPFLLWPNAWMDEDATWYGSRPRSRPLCIDGFPSIHERGTAAPCFRTMSIVATVDHLSYCGALVTSSVQCILLAAGRRSQAGDATDQWRDQWRRRLECVVQQQGGYIEHFDVKTAGCDSYFRQ